MLLNVYVNTSRITPKNILESVIKVYFGNNKIEIVKKYVTSIKLCTNLILKIDSNIL